MQISTVQYKTILLMHRLCFVLSNNHPAKVHWQHNEWKATSIYFCLLGEIVIQSETEDSKSNRLSFGLLPCFWTGFQFFKKMIEFICESMLEVTSDHGFRSFCFFFDYVCQDAWEELPPGQSFWRPPEDGWNSLFSSLMVRCLQGNIQIWQLEGYSYSTPYQILVNSVSFLSLKHHNDPGTGE